MFYYDNNVAKFEKELDYTSLLNYLEKQYLKNKTDTNLITIITYSWYLNFEGDVNQSPLTYDANLCFK